MLRQRSLGRDSLGRGAAAVRVHRSAIGTRARAERVDALDGDQGLQDDRADRLERLNAQIQDHEAKVGPSFLMRDLAGTGLQDVWRYEILPLLAEHHNGKGVDLKARYGLATLRRQVTRDAAHGAEGASLDD